MSGMSLLLSPFDLRAVRLKNRVVMSPMCQYSAQDGFITDWHLTHYPARALGGVGLVVVEATAVEARGRISAEDLGIWSDDHVTGLRVLAERIAAAGAVPGIQLAHAGRKAGTARPWPSDAVPFSWRSVAPSATAFNADHPVPHALEAHELEQVRDAFQHAARRALAAGFRVLELHMAHGYLLHEFLSPLSNHRSDAYGGSFEGRTRFPLEVVKAVREVMPSDVPLMVRVSASDWVEGGWTPSDTVHFAHLLGPLGVDLLDCSSGGAIPGVRIPAEPSYQVAFAERVRREAGMPAGAVGLITEPAQAEHILQSAQADLIFLARALLSDPFWTYHAARMLGQNTPIWPPQYNRAFP
jgi:2,4-dienoyl-CoA reductase-like NADH-dependent reductase (Old Yellow Enzyme family)